MRFLSRFLLAVGTIVLFFAGAAHFVDPRGDFGGRRFLRVTMDSRMEKMRLFEAYAASGKVGGLILGSSRSMKIDPKELERRLGARFFNFSVDSARAEDYLAIYRWARRYGNFRYLIVGLDVEALHDDDLPDPRLQQNHELVAELGNGTHDSTLPGRLLGRLRKYPDMFTAAYVADMTRSVARYLRPGVHKALATEFASDGLLHYLRLERDRAAGTFDLDRQISDSLPEYVNRFRDMRGLSARRRDHLEQLIREARSDGATVKVWLTTLHPLTARYLDQRTGYAAMLSRTRTYLAGLRERYRVDVYDYSEPQRFGGSLTAWYDGAHFDKANASLIAAGLAGPSQDLGQP
jgi:hypothetical protein